MKSIKSTFILSVVFLFISCSAWPALIPPPPASKKTSIYPIPLPGQTTSTTPAVRITDIGGTTSLSSVKLAFGQTKVVRAIDANGNDISSAITWTSGTTAVATVSSTTSQCTVTATSTAGNSVITAKHTSLGSATMSVDVNATGTSVLAFDGKQFLEFSTVPNTNSN